ncbi:MAG: DUF58 domain-containing protein [Planctomycetota bacterium]|nr:DUF58 domain-containing protein [Planctomycetota bacterium]
MTAQSDNFFDESFLRRLEQLHLIAKRIAAGSPAGVRASGGLGAGLEFADHREYTPGDDPRFIDWPYYARMGKLLVRLFHEHSEAAVAVLVDCSGSMAPGGSHEKFDYARRAAAALAYVAMGSGQKVLLIPFAADLGAPLRTGRSREGIMEVLEHLGRLQPGGTTQLARCLDLFVRQYEPPGAALVVSDLLDCGGGLTESLRRLDTRRCAVTAIHLQSPADAGEDLEGPVLMRDVESGREAALVVTPAVRESYQRTWSAFLARCRHDCASAGVTYVPAPTTVPFDMLVLETLRRAGVLSA